MSDGLTHQSTPPAATSRVFRQVVSIEIVWGYDPAQVDEEHREHGPYVDWEATVRAAVMEGGPCAFGTFCVPCTGVASEVEELTGV